MARMRRPPIGIVARFGLLLVIGCSSGQLPTKTIQFADPEAALHTKVDQSIVYLQFWTEPTKDGPSEVGGFGTGFVITDSNKNKWILTAAHSLAPVNSNKRIICVRYRLPNQGTFSYCGEAVVDETHDLAALRPNSGHPLAVPSLELYKGELPLKTKLYAIGSASALSFTTYDGYHNADPITVAQMADARKIPLKEFAPLGGELTLVRHSIPIAAGFSGCPVLTEDGKVVGLQSSTLKDAAFVGFAVHYKHIEAFEWDKNPKRLVAIDLTNFNADRVLALTNARPVKYKTEPLSDQAPPKGKEPLPVKIKLGGIDVEAPFIHHGYVERDAKTVIEKYVQDKEWYNKEEFGGVRVQRLQELLDRTQLARISNPLLGFQMLVPKGYRYSALPTKNPDGLLVTFDPPADRKVSKIYDWPLSIWVTVEPKLFVNARNRFSNKVQAGEVKPTEAEKANPALFATFRDRYVKAIVADAVDPRFATNELDLRIEDAPNEFRGNPKSDVFKQLTAGEGAWLRSNYQAVEGSLCHLVRIGSRDPLVLLVHYQYAKKDVIAFLDSNGAPDLTFLEYTILASTVSSK